MSDPIIRVAVMPDTSNFETDLLKKLKNIKQTGEKIGIEIPIDIQKQIEDAENSIKDLQQTINSLNKTKLNNTTFGNFQKKIGEQIELLDKRTTALENGMNALIKTMSAADGGKFANEMKIVSSAMEGAAEQAKNITDAIKSIDSVTSQAGISTHIISQSDIKNMKDYSKNLTDILNKIDKIVDEANAEPIKVNDKNLKDINKELSTIYDKIFELEEKKYNLDINVNKKEYIKIQNEIVSLYENLQKELSGILQGSHTDFINKIKVSDLGFDDITNELESELSSLRNDIRNQIERINEDLEHVGQDLKVGQNRNQLTVPIDISPRAYKRLNTSAKEVISKVQNTVTKNPLEVEFALVSGYTSKRGKEIAKQLQNQIEGLENGELKDSLTELSNNIQKRMTQEMQLDITVGMTKSSKNVQEDIKAIQTVLNDKDNRLYAAIIPSFNEEEMSKMQEQLNEASKNLILNISKLEISKDPTLLSASGSPIDIKKDKKGNRISSKDSQSELVSIESQIKNIEDAGKRIQEIVNNLDFQNISSQLNTISEQVKIISDILRIAFNIDITEIDNKFNSLKESLSAFKGINFSTKEGKEVKNQIKEIVKTYQEYLDLGGTRDIIELSDDKKIQGYLKQYFNELKQASEDVNITGKKIGQNLIDGTIESIKSASGDILSNHLGQDLAAGYAEGIRQGYTDVANAAKGLVKVALNSIDIVQNRKHRNFQETSFIDNKLYSDNVLESLDYIRQSNIKNKQDREWGLIHRNNGVIIGKQGQEHSVNIDDLLEQYDDVDYTIHTHNSNIAAITVEDIIAALEHYLDYKIPKMVVSGYEKSEIFDAEKFANENNINTKNDINNLEKILLQQTNKYDNDITSYFHDHFLDIISFYGDTGNSLLEFFNSKLKNKNDKQVISSLKSNLESSNISFNDIVKNYILEGNNLLSSITKAFTDLQVDKKLQKSILNNFDLNSTKEQLNLIDAFGIKKIDFPHILYQLSMPSFFNNENIGISDFEKKYIIPSPNHQINSNIRHSFKEPHNKSLVSSITDQAKKEIEELETLFKNAFDTAQKYSNYNRRTSKGKQHAIEIAQLYKKYTDAGGSQYSISDLGLKNNNIHKIEQEYNKLCQAEKEENIQAEKNIKTQQESVKKSKEVINNIDKENKSKKETESVQKKAISSEEQLSQKKNEEITKIKKNIETLNEEISIKELLIQANKKIADSEPILINGNSELKDVFTKRQFNSLGRKQRNGKTDDGLDVSGLAAKTLRELNGKYMSTGDTFFLSEMLNVIKDSGFKEDFQRGLIRSIVNAVKSTVQEENQNSSSTIVQKKKTTKEYVGKNNIKEYFRGNVFPDGENFDASFEQWWNKNKNGLKKKGNKYIYEVEIEVNDSDVDKTNQKLDKTKSKIDTINKDSKKKKTSKNKTSVAQESDALDKQFNEMIGWITSKKDRNGNLFDVDTDNKHWINVLANAFVNYQKKGGSKSVEDLPLNAEQIAKLTVKINELKQAKKEEEKQSEKSTQTHKSEAKSVEEVASATKKAKQSKDNYIPTPAPVGIAKGRDLASGVAVGIAESNKAVSDSIKANQNNDEAKGFKNISEAAIEAGKAKQYFSEENALVLKSIIDSLSGLQNEQKAFTAINEILSKLANDKKMESIIANFKELISLSQTKMSNTTVFRVLKDMVNQGEALKDLATVLRSTRKQIEKGQQALSQNNEKTDNITDSKTQLKSQEKTEEINKEQSAIDELSKGYKELINQVKQYNELSLRAAQTNGIISQDDELFLEKYNQNLLELNTRLEKINSNSGNRNIANDLQDQLYGKLSGDTSTYLRKFIETNSEKIDSKLLQNANNGRSFNTSFSAEVTEATEKLTRLQNMLNTHPASTAWTDIEKQEIGELTSEIEQTIFAFKDANNYFANESGIEKFGSKIEKVMRENSAMSSELMRKFEELRDKYEKLASSGSITPIISRSLTGELNSLVHEMEKAGKVGRNFFDTMIHRAGSMTASWAAMYLSGYDAIRYFQQAFETIRSLDTALVDLRKTTTMSNSDLEEFYLNSNNIAKQMGVTTEEIINQAAAWSRLNKIGLLYSNV